MCYSIHFHSELQISRNMQLHTRVLVTNASLSDSVILIAFFHSMLVDHTHAVPLRGYTRRYTHTG